MTNSFSKTQSIVCPQCSETFEAETWLIVDSSELPDVMERISDGTVHTISCPWCGSQGEQDSSLLIFRRVKSPHLFYIPAQNLTPKDFERDAMALLKTLKASLRLEWRDDWEQGMLTTSYRFISAELSDNRPAAFQEQARAEMEDLQRKDPEAFQQLVKVLQMTKQNPALVQQMQAFIQADTLQETRQAVEQNPRLLSEEGQSLLEGMLRIAELQHDHVGVNLLGSQLGILRTCRKLGVDLGIELLTRSRMIIDRIQEIPDRELDELSATILTFVSAKIWEKYNLLIHNPELLSDLADDLLVLLIGTALNEEDEDSRLAFEKNRSLLSSCREMGIEPGFSQILVLPEEFKTPDQDLPLRFRLELMHLSEHISLESPDVLSNSFANTVALLTAPRSRMAADFEDFDPQALHFIETFWKHILENPDLAKADLDFQSYVWRMAGALYDNLYQVSSNLAHLDRSIVFYRRAIGSGSLSLEDLFLIHVSLSNALDRRYEHLRLPGDLEESLQSIKQAMEVAQKHNLKELVIALSIFGDSLRKFFWQTNQLVHLEKAIQVLQQAIGRLGPNSAFPSIYYEALCNLSNVYGDLFEVTGQFEYLNEAVRTLQIVVDEAPHAPFLNNYGNLLMDRYKFVGKADDLDSAIKVYEKAISKISPNHHMTPAIYGNLGSALLELYSRTGQANDIRKAIALSRKAIKMLSEDAQGLAGIMQGLSSSLMQQFLHMKKKRQTLIDKAVWYARKTIELTGFESPDYGRYHITLGNCLKTRYEHIPSESDLEAAVDAYRKGCELGMNGLQLATLAAAQNWGQWAFQRKNWLECTEALGYARQVAENLIRNQTLREDKANWIGQINNLYTLLAYALIRSGSMAEAVEAIEQGRAQLMRESLERQRKDFGRLPELGFSDLHDHFVSVLQKEKDLQNLSPEHRKKDWLAQIESVRHEIEEVAQTIRNEVGSKYPEYGFFLHSLPFDEIQKQAQSSPVVYLFATSVGGMALVLRSQGLKVVELPEFTDQVLWNHMVGQDGTPSYIHALFTWRQQPSNPIYFESWKTVLDTSLAWIWRMVMGPLASELGDEANIMLIPSGLLGLLPLHAAWHQEEHTESGRHYFLDQYNVAYAPSAQALYYARLNINRPAESLLAIENPRGDLTYSQDAVKFAQLLFPSSLILQKKSTNRKTVLKDLGEYSVLYFFTHGTANFEQPLESGLLLADKESLTLRDMFNIHTNQARLAVLSACESGLPADLKQLDEVVSLPSGLIQVGIPGVLGSYWPVLEASTAILITIFFDQWRKYNLPAPAALSKAQIILRNAAHDPVARDYFKAFLSEHTAISTLGADIMYKQMHLSNFEHPFFWAAFAYHGI